MLCLWQECLQWSYSCSPETLLPISVTLGPRPALNLNFTFHPVSLRVPLQLGQEMFIAFLYVFLLCTGKECLLQLRGICISAVMTKPKCILPACWKKDSAQETTVQIANGCGLSVVFLNREKNATLSWEMSQNWKKNILLNITRRSRSGKHCHFINTI